MNLELMKNSDKELESELLNYNFYSSFICDCFTDSLENMFFTLKKINKNKNYKITEKLLNLLIEKFPILNTKCFLSEDDLDLHTRKFFKISFKEHYKYFISKEKNKIFLMAENSNNQIVYRKILPTVLKSILTRKYANELYSLHKHNNRSIILAFLKLYDYIPSNYDYPYEKNELFFDIFKNRRNSLKNEIKVKTDKFSEKLNENIAKTVFCDKLSRNFTKKITKNLILKSAEINFINKLLSKKINFENKEEYYEHCLDYFENPYFISYLEKEGKKYEKIKKFEEKMYFTVLYYLMCLECFLYYDNIIRSLENIHFSERAKESPEYPLFQITSFATDSFDKGNKIFVDVSTFCYYAFFLTNKGIDKLKNFIKNNNVYLNEIKFFQMEKNYVNHIAKQCKTINQNYEINYEYLNRYSNFDYLVTFYTDAKEQKDLSEFFINIFSLEKENIFIRSSFNWMEIYFKLPEGKTFENLKEEYEFLLMKIGNVSKKMFIDIFVKEKKTLLYTKKDSYFHLC